MKRNVGREENQTERYEPASGNVMSLVMPKLEHLEELDPGHFGSRLYLDFLAKELD